MRDVTAVPQAGMTVEEAGAMSNDEMPHRLRMLKGGASEPPPIRIAREKRGGSNTPPPGINDP